MQLHLFTIGPHTSLERSRSHIEFQNSPNARNCHLGLATPATLRENADRTEEHEEERCSFHVWRDSINSSRCPARVSRGSPCTLRTGRFRARTSTSRGRDR